MRGTRLTDRQSRRHALPVLVCLVVDRRRLRRDGQRFRQARPPRSRVRRSPDAKAFDVSKPLRELARDAKRSEQGIATEPGAGPDRQGLETPSELSARLAGGRGARRPRPRRRRRSARCGRSRGSPTRTTSTCSASASTRPIPVGDVGPNHYVEMINLVFAVYDKTGNKLLGPIDTGTLWAGFPGRRLHRPVRRPDRRPRPVRRPLDPDPVHDPRPGRSHGPGAVLQLRRDLADRRSDRRVLPLCLHDGSNLPRLPEVRRLEGLLRHHDARVRPDGASTGSASMRSTGTS